VGYSRRDMANFSVYLKIADLLSGENLFSETVRGLDVSLSGEKLYQFMESGFLDLCKRKGFHICRYSELALLDRRGLPLTKGTFTLRDGNANMYGNLNTQKYFAVPFELTKLPLIDWDSDIIGYKGIDAQKDYEIRLACARRIVVPAEEEPLPPPRFTYPSLARPRIEELYEEEVKGIYGEGVFEPWGKLRHIFQEEDADQFSRPSMDVAAKMADLEKKIRQRHAKEASRK